jgi:hypothetical protein
MAQDPLAPELNPLDEIQFADAHRVTLHPGSYTIRLSHDVQGVDAGGLGAASAEAIDRWFEDLSLLVHVPFPYLVPSEELLPQESLRFFAVDPHWLECLRDGAFSIGRVLETDRQRETAIRPTPVIHRGAIATADRQTAILAADAARKDGEYAGCQLRITAGAARGQWRMIRHYEGASRQAELDRGWDADETPDGTSRYEIHTAPPPHSGLLLRSEVVAGWPGLRVDGYAGVPEAGHENRSRAALLRMERLSKNVLLCLFDREVHTVDFHLKPETLHFGFDDASSLQTLTKTLRNAQGEDGTVRLGAAELALDAGTLVANLATLAESIRQKLITQHVIEPLPAPLTSDRFALQMVSGADLIRFQRT